MDLISLNDWSDDDLIALLDLASAMKAVIRRPIKKVPTLRGKAVANVFFEASTRTRNSFELAGKYLGADVINFQGSGSSIEKGETLWDTVRTLQAMRLDAVVVRHGASGVPQVMAEHLEVPVINAGDGTHHHPTQGLLDVMTVRERFGHVEGLTVAIVGDVLHSRVARSDIEGFVRLGAKIRLVGPPSLMPSGLESQHVAVYADLKDGLAGVDVIQVLRIQKERQQSGQIPSLREYHDRWGLTQAALHWAQPKVLVLHPGPQNRGVEIDSQVMEDPVHSAILDQVENGVAVRMAVLYRLIGGEGVSA
ncbi:MAG: aspartate carbamoyltransferase catalytic subunit [Firmicutes bacterium]|jgi:aspartate carbamoyltransferase catalytic subunit|nr:aspartate carbamoyltransferase catalytic subunit [Bacillota bacterium]